MPKGRTVLTAKQQILIALTYMKLSDRTSEIEKVLGFKSSQINRDLNESGGLLDEGLVEKDPKGFLVLTEKGKSDPIVRMSLITRFIGRLILFLGTFMIAHLAIGLLLGLISNVFI